MTESAAPLLETGIDDFWRGRSVLVTGGCGFIGSHLVEELLRRGSTVRVLDLYSISSSWGHLSGKEQDRLEVRLGDVADAYFTREAVEGIDTIFHLAALIGIPYSYRAPAHYVRTNVDGTLAVLEAARALGVRRVVHTSTSETYGSAQYQPMDEGHPCQAQSPYAATKIACDQLAASYYRCFGLPVVTCRPFNTYGPRQSLRAVLPTIVSQALYSDEIVVGSLSPVRDMNYVTDTVDGFMRLGHVDSIEGEAFNIGSGTAYSIKEMIDIVQQVLDIDKPIKVSAERVRPASSEVARLVCDSSKARLAVGYEPSVSFDLGVRKVRDYLAALAPDNVSSYYV